MRGAVTRPTLAPSVNCPQPATGTVSPAAAEVAAPLISRPVAVPLPSVARMLLTVTTPPNNETELSVTVAALQLEPLVVAESRARIDPDAGYAEGPRRDAPAPNRITGCVGGTRAATPPPTQPVGSEEGARGVYDGVVVVSIVVVVVVPVVVVPVPAARAEATPTTAAITPRTRSQTPRRTRNSVTTPPVLCRPPLVEAYWRQKTGS